MSEGTSGVDPGATRVPLRKRNVPFLLLNQLRKQKRDPGALTREIKEVRATREALKGRGKTYGDLPINRDLPTGEGTS